MTNVPRTLKEAEGLVGTLSKPSKMPGFAYGIPAKNCPIGSLLVKINGSVCSSCYALKGRYVFPNVKNAQEKRLASLTHPDWVDTIVWMLEKKKCDYFRWHDSGDIQGMWHLEKIVEVAIRSPNVRFWIPTREKKVVLDYLRTVGPFPLNLIVRVSGTMIDGPPPIGFPNTSTVTTKGGPTCPAYKQDGVCGPCRACWNPSVQNVSYPKH